MDPLGLAEGQRRLAQIQGHLQIYIYMRGQINFLFSIKVGSIFEDSLQNSVHTIKAYSLLY